ncbi:MAG: kduD [Microbacteriaceae bacterium]|nr:kduD [Microbacteriaceae bacterium]
MADSGRTFLITGGTGGLGGGLAMAFAEEDGATVIVTGATEAEVTAATVDPRLAKATVKLLDVRSDEDVLALVGQLPRLDVLVNAAGIMSSPADFTVEGFERSIDINLLGTVRVCFAAREKLAASKGNIINFASMMSFRGTPTGPAYAAGKAGIALLTQSLATAWAPDVRVNAIAPGFITSPMTLPVQADPVKNTRIVGRIPAGRWGEPGDLVSGARFLASGESAYVTGIILPIDGGYLTT